MSTTEEAKSTIFRFVTVRAPQKPSVLALQRVLVQPTANEESSFATNLRSLRNDANESEAQRLAAMQSAARDYQATEDFIATEADLNVLCPRLAAFSEWLMENELTLSHTNLQSYLTGKDFSSEEEHISRLWDNLFAYMIAGGKPEVREAIAHLLKAYHISQKYDDSNVVNGEKELRQLLTASLVLPSSTFPLPASREPITRPEPSEPNEAETEKYERAYTQYKAAESALEELQALYEEQADKIPEGSGLLPIEEKCKPETPDETEATETYVLNRISQNEWEELSETTQTLLTTLKIRVGATFTKSMEKVQQYAKKQYEQLWEKAETSQNVYRVGGAFWSEARTFEEPTLPSPYTSVYNVPDNFYDGFYYNDGKCHIKPLGMMEFKRVEQKLCCYVPGEVAHIENILQGEYRERSTRRLRRSEDTVATFSESEKLTEKDSQTADRYEMEKETSKTIAKDLSFQAGMSVAGPAGPVTIEASTNFAASISSTESNRNAINYAKDVTERSLQRIIERVREERITKIIEEFEEVNKHILDNRNNTNGHVVGLYRWMDKVYEAQVVNYGKRLVLEFMIPEPGAFHIWAMTKGSIMNDVSLTEPLDPRKVGIDGTSIPPLRTHKDVSETNYHYWSADYGVKVDAPPSLYTSASGSFAKGGLGGTDYAEAVEIQLPEGYRAVRVFFRGHHKAHRADVRVGGLRMFEFPANLGWQWDYLDLQTKSLHCSIYMEHADAVAFNIEVELQRTPEAYEAWQMATFQAIMDAYQGKKMAFDNAVAEARTRRGVNIQGTNPALNRKIEQDEIKKSCINWMFNGEDFTSWAVWNTESQHEWIGPITQTNCMAIEMNERIKFMETAFDWNLMTYQLYPYFWGAKCRWKKLYQLNDSDPLFLNFLQAGAAKVLIPVKPGYELAIMYFLRTGIVGFTGSVLGFQSPISDAILYELSQRNEEELVATPEGATWQIRVPTTLNVLQCGSGCVEGDGLPCACDPENVVAKSKGSTLTGNSEGNTNETPL
ncbi:MAG: hypothetical protein ACKVTZ_10960 [Bacteroidia bacterium]